MSLKTLYTVSCAVVAISISACDTVGTGSTDSATAGGSAAVSERAAKYTSVTLAADTTNLTPKERQMIPLLIEASKVMDEIYWAQTWGSRDSLFQQVSDPAMRNFIDVNYGPYDRLDNNVAFVSEIGSRPPGANLYPQDITKEEFEAEVAKGPPAHADSLKSLYTLVRRRDDRSLYAIPYHVAFKAQNERASAKLREAAKLAE